MKLAKYRLPSGQTGVGRVEVDQLLPFDLSSGQYRSLFEILEADNPNETAEFLTDGNERIPLEQLTLLPPIDQQEVWAAGVTYLRSRDARIEESKDAGGGTFYDKVYLAERPELFFKASPFRVVNPGEHVRIRKDSDWNVPEPELTLFLNNRGKISGYTIGNDMSSRSIEGENPLYLPQAKVYDGSAAVGPCIYVSRDRLPSDTLITILIERKGENVFDGQVRVDRIKRDLNELAEYLFRECSFPYGCFLMTGTGVVPPNEFTLQEDDQISISIDNIGTLKNVVST